MKMEMIKMEMMTCQMLPNDEASDAEEEQVLEIQEEYDSDDENCDVQPSDQVQTAADNMPPSTLQDFTLFGKDGTKWSKIPPLTGRIRAHNIMQFTGGPVEKNSIPIEVFKKFFTSNIIFIILKEKNEYANNIINFWNAGNPSKIKKVWKNLAEVELNACSSGNRNSLQKYGPLPVRTNTLQKFHQLGLICF